MRRLVSLWLFLCSAGWSAEPSDLDFVLASSLPPELAAYLREARDLDAYALSAWIHLAVRQHFLVGAGTAVGNGGDDFAVMDAWYVYSRGIVSQSAHEERAPPVLSGDAVMVIKTEAASAVVYWTGAEYGWYQQAD